MTNEKRIEDIKESIAIYERNTTCLEACDWERYEDLKKELDALELGHFELSDAEIEVQEKAIAKKPITNWSEYKYSICGEQ